MISDVVDKSIDDIRLFNDDTSLTEIGLDSIRFIQLVVKMEEEFGIEINDSDLLISNFETISVLFKTMEKYFDTPAPPKKALILDCDNVLWLGIAGEEEIAVNNNILTFHKELLQLYEQGVLLCLCSRNEQRNIEEAFLILDPPLSGQYIACSKINPDNKVKNIKEIAVELNLSADSFVFADDDEYELGLINALLPEIYTVKVDYNCLSFIEQIKNLFINTSDGSLNRTQLYREQKEREKEKLHFDTVEEYNRALQTQFDCGLAAYGQAERLSELSLRTNQFNLSGERYSVDEIRQMINNPDYLVVFMSVTDKYGYMGIVGAAVIKTTDKKAVIENFMLSCRVFSRGFEKVLLDKIKTLSEKKVLKGIYRNTDKNIRYASFYLENGVELYE